MQMVFSFKTLLDMVESKTSKIEAALEIFLSSSDEPVLAGIGLRARGLGGCSSPKFGKICKKSATIG